MTNRANMTVAVAVATGAADCGLGILAAARAMGLDFVPVTRERFDLAVPEEYMESPLVKRVRAVLEEEDVRMRLWRERAG